LHLRALEALCGEHRAGGIEHRVLGQAVAPAGHTGCRPCPCHDRPSALRASVRSWHDKGRRPRVPGYGAGCLASGAQVTCVLNRGTVTPCLPACATSQDTSVSGMGLAPTSPGVTRPASELSAVWMSMLL